MTHPTNRQKPQTYTLPAGDDTELLFDDEGMDTRHADTLFINLSNTGASACETITRIDMFQGTPLADPVNYGPLAANANLQLPLSDLRGDAVRLVGNSTVGTTLVVGAEARAAGPS